MKKHLLAALLSIAALSPAFADQVDARMVRDWIVSQKPDPFEGKDLVYAAHEDEKWLTILRCRGGEFQLVLIPMRDVDTLERNEVFDVQFRVDLRDIRETHAIAVDPKFLQVMVTPDMLADMPHSTQMAIRFKRRDGVGSFDRMVDMTNSFPALKIVVRHCAKFIGKSKK